jgi:hypothetical protein
VIAGASAPIAGSVATAHWTSPMYDEPIIPTGPSHHGWSPSQRSVASPSARSSNGANVPPDPNVPRTDCTTTWKPRSAIRRP